MFKTTLKPLLAGAVGTAALSMMVSVEPARAYRVTYDFAVDIPTGVYAGNHRGSFSYDDTGLIGTGLESVTPSKGGLTVLFNLLGTTYTAQNDPGFNNPADEFPKVFFDSGKLLGLSFLVLPPAADPGFMIVANKSKNPATGADVAGGIYIGDSLFTFDKPDGSVSYSLRTNSAAVPEPSEIAGSLVAIGLLGVGLKLRSRRKKLFSDR